jgi:hypothetical protein
VQPSSLVLLAIVVVWAAYLVPHWVRRRDELSQSRAGDRFSGGLRVLKRRDRSGRSGRSGDPLLTSPRVIVDTDGELLYIPADRMLSERLAGSSMSLPQSAQPGETLTGGAAQKSDEPEDAGREDAGAAAVGGAREPADEEKVFDRTADDEGRVARTVDVSTDEPMDAAARESTSANQSAAGVESPSSTRKQSGAGARPASEIASEVQSTGRAGLAAGTGSAVVTGSAAGTGSVAGTGLAAGTGSESGTGSATGARSASAAGTGSAAESGSVTGTGGVAGGGSTADAGRRAETGSTAGTASPARASSDESMAELEAGLLAGFGLSAPSHDFTASPAPIQATAEAMPVVQPPSAAPSSGAASSDAAMAELEAGLLAGFGLPAPGQPAPGQPERKGRTGYPGQAESIPVVHPALPETAPDVSSGRPVPPVPKAPPASTIDGRPSTTAPRAAELPYDADDDPAWLDGLPTTEAVEQTFDDLLGRPDRRAPRSSSRPVGREGGGRRRDDVAAPTEPRTTPAQPNLTAAASSQTPSPQNPVRTGQTPSTEPAGSAFTGTAAPEVSSRPAGSAPVQPGQAAFTEAASPESYSARSARGSANQAGSHQSRPSQTQAGQAASTGIGPTGVAAPGASSRPVGSAQSSANQAGSYPSQPSQAQARQAASAGTGSTGAAPPEASSRPSGPAQGSAGSDHPQAESFRAASAQPGYAPGRPHPARATETSSRSAEAPKTTNRASTQAPYDQAAPVQEAFNPPRPAAAARSSQPRANQPRTNPAENPSRPPTPTRGRPPADRLEPSPPESGPLEAEEALASEYSTTPADLEAARHGARIAARRRARSMAVLLLTTVVTWVFLAVGSLPVFIAIASTLLLTAHAVASRTAAVRSRETLTMLAAHLYAADMAREHAENRRRQAARVRARAEAEAAAQPPPERVTRRAGAVSADTWDPIPVPPPTYQLKPAVHRPAPPPLESPVQNPAAQKPQTPPGSDSNRGDQPVSRGSMPRRAADIERILELDQDADRPRAVNE